MSDELTAEQTERLGYARLRCVQCGALKPQLTVFVRLTSTMAVQLDRIICDTCYDTALDDVGEFVDPFARLAALNRLRDHLRVTLADALEETCAEIREQGGTWKQIAARLGITKQAAEAQYSAAGRERLREVRRARSAEARARAIARARAKAGLDSSPAPPDAH